MASVTWTDGSLSSRPYFVAGLHLSSDPRADAPRLDAALLARLRAPHGSSQVIIRTTTNLPIDDVVREAGGTTIRSLGAASVVALVPDGALARLAANPRVASVSADRRVTSTAAAGGVLDRIARLPQALGVDGSGVGVATIDSGISAGHEVIASGRLAHWMDFVSHLDVPYDDYGHGTHVAGIIAAGDGGDRRRDRARRQPDRAQGAGRHRQRPGQ